ncbi:hypothetical protein ZIOFF_007983 [Zingiber officinale]|uniref:Uncharacterized protein n=1 Tax=Zingiber officinale TaxID=94328 RepID=A0A8J5I2K7_ZINOF|nr:hypothetical protein ZIOFF_007983 [Zingiber officinale]
MGIGNGNRFAWKSRASREGSCHLRGHFVLIALISSVLVVVIQHPGGKAKRLYWPTSAADVMKSNPGHYMALVTLTVSETKQDGGAVKFTRVRLLNAKAAARPDLQADHLPSVRHFSDRPEATQAIMQRKQNKLKKYQAESCRGQLQEEEHMKPAAAGEAQQEDSENKPQVCVLCCDSGGEGG